jgi:hypothetical protein
MLIAIVIAFMVGFYAGGTFIAIMVTSRER